MLQDLIEKWIIDGQKSCFIDPNWLFSKEQVVDARTLIGVMSDQSN